MEVKLKWKELRKNDEVLLGAINLVDGSGSPEEQLRKVMQLQKKRFFKNTSVNKNKMKMKRIES
ncbi:uncharacterized protein Dwil_GK27051 [Drosophila willistoni]|uniref:Uncharacterized protein n=1 Tax=Drosophila willistoni TaxID=7260 RepID=A0A0Q9WWK1_DROWI|nr:uncharacterized protein Dwil_GK27051 [Drosophila willistoni]